jgi:hypothetical protein
MLSYVPVAVSSIRAPDLNFEEDLIAPLRMMANSAPSSSKESIISVRYSFPRSHIEFFEYVMWVKSLGQSDYVYTLTTFDMQGFDNDIFLQLFMTRAQAQQITICTADRYVDRIPHINTVQQGGPVSSTYVQHVLYCSASLLH